MKLQCRPFELRLAHRWAIASRSGPGAGSGTDLFPVVFAQLTDEAGITGYGESAPSARYRETVQTVQDFLAKFDPSPLSFFRLEEGLEIIEKSAPGNPAAKTALEIAFMDGAARVAGKPVYERLGLGFTEGKHVTSFSIGLDKPEVIRKKVEEASRFPVLKLKLGSITDKENLAALREAAPTKKVRVDANEAWTTKEIALRNIEWLAGDPNIQFVEQPMPANSDPKAMAWLKQRSPLPVMGDESYRSAADIDLCADCFHAVNVKLVKTGGISPGYAALHAARKQGLKTMLGCMIESSVLITAAAHLAELTDYLDLDGNLLITNDPYRGCTAEKGVVTFESAPDPIGLRVQPRDL